jgi:uncharacterized protein
MIYAMFQQMKKSLTQIETWFDKANEFATSKSFDAEVLVNQRLAPDQFALARQVQITCDTAKLGAARLTGKEAPSHADTEKTFGELKQRIHETVAFLNTLTEADFASADTRVITQPRWEGKTMVGKDYFLEHVMPNFFFHVSHAYAILRHNGVPVGKKDYLGKLSMK